MLNLQILASQKRECLDKTKLNPFVEARRIYHQKCCQKQELVNQLISINLEQFFMSCQQEYHRSTLTISKLYTIVFKRLSFRYHLSFHEKRVISYQGCSTKSQAVESQSTRSKATPTSATSTGTYQQREKSTLPLCCYLTKSTGLKAIIPQISSTALQQKINF